MARARNGAAESDANLEEAQEIGAPHQANDAADAENEDEVVPAGYVRVVVAARRSLRVPVVIARRFEGEQEVDVLGHRTALAGEPVTVRADEVDDLRALGFVVNGHHPVPEIHVADAGTGPTVNGRPGGMLRFGER